MQKHRKEIITVFSLTAVLLLLVSGIALQLIRVSENAPTESVSADIQYEKYRPGRVALFEGGALENNIGGEEDETPVEVIAVNERIYIFVNTLSTTLDFSQGAGGYMCVLDRDLTTVAFHYLGELNIAGATVGEGGFTVAFSSDNQTTLRIFGFDGALLSNSLVIEGGFCSLMLCSDGYTLITEEKASELSKRKLKVTAISFNLSVKFSKTLSSSRDMDFISAYENNGRLTLFFNAVNDLGSRLGACLVSQDSSITYLLKEGNYKTDEVLPYETGFIASTVSSSGGGILLIDEEFNSDFAFSAEGDFTVSSLTYGDGLYYALFSGDTGEGYAFESPESANGLDYFSSAIEISDTLSGEGYALFCVKNSERNRILSDGGRVEISFGEGGDAFIVMLDGNIYAVTAVNKSCSDCAANFGKTDIMITKLSV